MMPYHAAITELLDRRAMAGRATILVSLHSFTPMLRARPAPRPWQVGLCWGADDRFSRLVLRALAAEGDLVVGANQPYRVDAAVDYSIPVHGEGRGLPYVEFEVRQDLIATPAAADAWAARLARVLEAARRGFAA
jgi:predicted N-formylglutamate amidohydrolase